ncbi:MAG: amidohydrolase family protein, partial [Chloroflexota bacterium]|nr:amidohydrolase family protein [Chloroflexota bacterium]
MSAQGSESELIISGGRVVTPLEILEPGTVVVKGGKIAAIEEGASQSGDEGKVINAEGLTVAPGLIDIHVHGAASHDTMDATPEALEEMALFFARHGVTSFLPTTMTASREGILAAVENIARCMEEGSDGAEILGVHLEGPYFNLEKKGAQPASQIRPADPEE